MLRSIHTVYTADNDDMGMNAYFYTNDAKLTVYKNLSNEAPVLIPEQFGSDHGIVLNIMSFM